MSGPDAHVLLGLVHCLCDDIAAVFPSLSRCLHHDKGYILRRVQAEGLSFLTTSLPKMGKVFDQWLRDETATLDFSSCYFAPKFLSGVKDLISRTDVRDSDRAHLYRWMRQLAFCFYKLEVPFDSGDLRVAYDAFIERDKELEKTDCEISPFESGEAAYILGQVFEDYNPHPLYPKHGPGSVATREVGDDKWCFRRHYRSIHRRFPMYDYFVPTLSGWRSDTAHFVTWYKSLVRLDSPTSRVVAVPKDSRGPRLISEEPLELQFMQQGYSARLVAHLERHRRTSGFVNFASQDINRNLALQSSRTGEMATIDLADASDRVSDYLVYLLFPEEMYRDLRALRSRRTDLPDGRTVTLQKFAAMGSAICFPIEAAVFWALSKGAIRKVTKGGDGDVYVYGDDIIVPREHCIAVCDELERFGLRVNRSKTYHTGFFRESCGIDAWKGYIITPSRIRQFPPSRPSQVGSLSNWVAVSNTLRENSFRKAADYIVQHVESVLSVPWNLSSAPLSFIDSEMSHSETRALNSKFRSRWNPILSRHELKVPSISQVRRLSTLRGWERLHRNLLCSPRDPNHWTPRRAVSLTTSWFSDHEAYERKGT